MSRLRRPVRAGALLGLGFLLGAVQAEAIGVQGHEFPETVVVDRQILHLNGVGIRRATIFSVKLYALGMYLPVQGKDVPAILAETGPKRFDFVFFRGFDKRSSQEAWKCQFEESVKTRYPGFEKDLNILVEAQGEIKEKGTLTFEINDQETRFYQEGALKAKIPGEKFGRALTEMFLGPRPPTEELKAGILGTQK